MIPLLIKCVVELRRLRVTLFSVIFPAARYVPSVLCSVVGNQIQPSTPLPRRLSMRHLIAPLSLSLSLSLALVAAPAFFAATLAAEEKKEEPKAEHAKGKPLGEVTLNGAVFTVELEGKLEAGKEIEIKLTPKGELPKGKVRGWVGIESGKGSMKGHSHAEDGSLCIHAEAPETIAADAKIWIEIEVDGAKSKVGLALPK